MRQLCIQDNKEVIFSGKEVPQSEKIKKKYDHQEVSMMLNWTTEAILYLISAGFLSVCLFLIIRLYLKTHYRYFLYASITCIGGVFWALLEGISLLVLSIPLHIIGNYFVFIAIYATMLGLDALSKNVFNPAKYFLLGLLFGAAIFSSILDPNAVKQYIGLNGEERLYWSGTFELIGILIFVVYYIYLTIGIVRIIKYSPSSMKNVSYFLYITLILYYIKPFILITPLIDIVPNCK